MRSRFERRLAPPGLALVLACARTVAPARSSSPQVASPIERAAPIPSPPAKPHDRLVAREAEVRFDVDVYMHVGALPPSAIDAPYVCDGRPCVPDQDALCRGNDGQPCALSQFARPAANAAKPI